MVWMGKASANTESLSQGSLRTRFALGPDNPFMVGIRRPKAQPRTSFEWPGMTHNCSHRTDLPIPAHPLLLQLFSHALANISSQNQATAKPVSPTGSRVSDQTPSSPSPQGRGSKQTMHSQPRSVWMCCSTGCSRAWQRNSRHPFSILCKPAQGSAPG